MDLLIQFGWLGFGLVLLYFGAEWLVGGSSEIAIKFGISPLVVGLTIVAFGTSAPEFFVTMQANLEDPPRGDISLANVIGSNICNIGLVLGFSALLKPIRIHQQVIKREAPILFIASVAFVFFLWDKKIERWEAGVLAVGIVWYVISSLRLAYRQGEDAGEEFSPEDIEKAKASGMGRMFLNIGLIILGLVALRFGALYLLKGGESIARHFGVPEVVIALLGFALGTSLPELATSIIALMKNKGDLIVGNAIGSCIFNIMAVIGIAGLVAPIAGPQLKWVDLGVMFGMALIVLPLITTGARLRRFEGGVLLGGYLAYCIWRSTGA